MRDKKNKTDPFVQKAFNDAVSQRVEIDAAFGTFADLFETLLAVFGKRLDSKDLEYFVGRNDDDTCRKAIKMIAETFFLCGFRNGVLFKERHGNRKERSDY